MNQIHRRRWRSPAVLICTAAGMVLVAVLVVVALKRSSTAPYVYTDLSTERDFEDESFESGGKWYGLCQRDSIRSVVDFRNTVASDQVLKTHFVGFEWERAVVKKLEKPVFAYVYFRKNDAIIRKAKPIKLPAGDEYITDGRRRIRTHCCNDYVEAPPPVVESSVEEPDGSLPQSASKIALLPGTSGAPASGASGASSGSSWPGFFSINRGSSGGSDPGCTGPGCNTDPGCTGPGCNTDPGCTGPECTYKTPEPGTGLMLAICLAFLAIAFFMGRFVIGKGRKGKTLG
jgi:hypothetical protein